MALSEGVRVAFYRYAFLRFFIGRFVTGWTRDSDQTTANVPVEVSQGRFQLRQRLGGVPACEASRPPPPVGFCAQQAGPTGREAPGRPAVSNAVALADILRCPVVVADQAAGQKDVEADRWVRVSAV